MVDISNVIGSFSSLLSRQKPDAVNVLVGSEFYGNWKNVSINRTMNSLTGSFRLSLVDKWRQTGGQWPLKPGQKVNISIGKEIIITGYIDSTEINYEKDERTVTITGRDKTADLVDCSAIGTGLAEYKLMTLAILAQTLCTPFGIIVDDKVKDFTTFKTWTIRQGESVFDTIYRAARLRGALVLSDEFGRLVITNRADVISENAFSAIQSAGELASSRLGLPTNSLIQAANIVKGSANYNNTDRYSEYTIKGQSAGDDFFNGTNVTEPSAKSTDAGVDRYRPKIIISDASIDSASAQKLANWEATTRAAKAVDVKISVKGWQRPDGSAWKINEIVRVDAGFLGVNTDMLIVAVNFSKSVGGGTITNLKLSRPDAFNPKQEVDKTKDPVDILGWDKFDGGKLRGISR